MACHGVIRAGWTSTQHVLPRDPTGASGRVMSSACPGRSAARSDALQTRDPGCLFKKSNRGPGSDGVTGPCQASRSLATALCGGALARGLLGGWRSSLKLMVSRTESGMSRSKHHRGTTMVYYAGIDVSLECSSVCVVDASGKIVREGKVASEPEALIAWFALAGVGAGADRAGSGAAVAMALRGDERSRPCGGAVGDAACA